MLGSPWSTPAGISTITGWPLCAWASRPSSKRCSSKGFCHWSRRPTSFGRVDLAGGRAADLHFHLDDDTVWVVLLDVTADRDAARRLQQKAYDMTLLQEREALLNQRLEATNAELLAIQR